MMGLALLLAACAPAVEPALEGELTSTRAKVDELTQQLNDAQAEIEALTQELGEMPSTQEESAATDHASQDDADGMMSKEVATENVIYGFGQGKIIVIEPESGTIVNEITDGLEDVSWGDPIASPDNSLLFVNERTNAQVLVIDTAKQEIIERLDVGPRPVHLYNPNHGNEIWTHSDEEGAFYVINIETLEVTAVVEAALTGTGHGKLVYGEGLGNKAYATNTNDPAAFIIDLDAKEQIGVVELCLNDEGEGGTHAKAYSEVSGHVYIECTSIPQTAIIDPESDELIGYLDGKGQLFPLPGDAQIAVMDKRQAQVRVIDASTDEIAASIDVEGGADKISFYEQDGTTYGFTANTLAPDAAVIDFTTNEVVKRIAAGDIERPEGARFLHRGGTIGAGYAALPASGDGIVSIIDAASQTLHAALPLEGATHVLFVGERE